MPDTELVNDLTQDYTKEQLVSMRKVLTTALLAPDAITGQQMEGIEFRFRPRSITEVEKLLALIRAAITQLDNPDALPDAPTMSHAFNFSPRRIE